ncbi:unnamed protein product [Umbelopsis vinacea]
MSDKTPTTAKAIDTGAQDDRPNTKRKLDQMSTIEGTSVAANSRMIEAKLGTIIDLRTRQRILLPVASEAADADLRIRFQSDMSLDQHRQYNVMLNEMVQKPPEGEKVKYKHTRERDRFFKLRNGKKIRVTTDQQTGEIVPNGVLEKTRIADLNIYSPNQAFDYRISVSLESPASIPEGSHMYERNKDRLSYSHGNIQFDLTQVKSPDSTGQQDVTHELELEFIDIRLLATEKKKQMQGEPSEFAAMIESEIKNVFKGDKKETTQQNKDTTQPARDSAPQVSRSEPSEIHDASLNQIHQAEEKERQDRMRSDQEQAKENANKLAHMVDENAHTHQ